MLLKMVLRVSVHSIWDWTIVDEVVIVVEGAILFFKIVTQTDRLADLLLALGVTSEVRVFHVEAVVNHVHQRDGMIGHSIIDYFLSESFGTLDESGIVVRLVNSCVVEFLVLKPQP